MAAAEQHAMQGGAFVVWTLTEADAEGESVNLSTYPMKTVMIEGGQARLLGRMHADGEAVELTDVHGYPLKGGLALVTLNPRFVAPVLVAGDRVRVSVIATKAGGL